ncbi:MAG: hypothetical protein M3511_07900 [Deinococcota bacterium]|nr:hypothetical protein [Deinococcota bacterium]
MITKTNIADDRHQYSVAMPQETPLGQPVTVQSSERGDVHLMHAESPDQSELYFEVTTYAEIVDHARLASEQRSFLGENAPDGELTAIAPAAIGRHSGTVFDFQGTLQGCWKVRRFLFVDGPHYSYRIVYDPTSALNHEILESLRVEPQGA